VVPHQDTVVQKEGRDIGRITSSAWSPAVNGPIALAYVQRDFVEPGTRVSIGEEAAVVTKVPFMSPRSG